MQGQWLVERAVALQDRPATVAPASSSAAATSKRGPSPAATAAATAAVAESKGEPKQQTATEAAAEQRSAYQDAAFAFLSAQNHTVSPPPCCRFEFNIHVRQFITSMFAQLRVSCFYSCWHPSLAL